MGELSEKRWAVISERGCEAAGVAHEEAVRLMRRLTGERVSGLCVVTEDAGRRIQASAQASPNGNRPPGATPAARRPARTKRTSKK